MHAPEVAAAADQNLEQPDCPERDHRHKAVVPANYSPLLPLFKRNVVTKKATGVRLQVGTLRFQFLGWSFRNRIGRPNLAVGMRITGPYHGAAVFEYLYVVDVFEPGQFPKLCDPGVDDELNLIPRHRGQGEIMTRRKANHAANPRFSFRD